MAPARGGARGESRATREDIDHELSRARLRQSRGNFAFSQSEHSTHLLNSTRPMSVSAKRDGASLSENSFDPSLSAKRRHRSGQPTSPEAHLETIEGSPRTTPRSTSARH